jgi:hypothetical protein
LVIELLDSISVSSLSNAAGILQLLIEETPVGQLFAVGTGLVAELCNINSAVVEALLAPYSTLIHNPDPNYQLGRWAGRVLALAIAGGEITVSVGGELGAILMAPATFGATGIAAIVAAPQAAAVALHGTAVIGGVIAKEANDPLLSRSLVLFAEANEAAGHSKFRGPAARGFDWEHIFDAHAEWGRIARQSGRKDIFTGLTKEQIKARVQAAWANRKLMETQVDYGSGITRMRYQGVDPVSGQTIEMWFNRNTRIVETAYPQ